MMWTKENVKRTFTGYFEKEKHIIVPQSSLIPPNNDTSILFTNSGMNQFKPIFIGENSNKLGSDLVCNIQRCIRAGGKHNDFDQVGKDTYHHSMFEMMGNWHFNCDGNNTKFKQDAIKHAWHLLVNIFGLDPDRIYVTYFSGFEGSQVLDADTETRDIRKQYLSENRILPFEKENFWEMAEVGPCGSCTEIHYDLIGNRNVADLVNKDDPTVIELWNLVFMEYERKIDGSFVNLKYKHVDTGMGFERLVCALQGKTSNYDTDIFKEIFDKIYIITGVPLSDETMTAYRVISDHIRSIIFSLNDDITPSSKGRGAIIHKLFERAFHYACLYLNARPTFMTELTEELKNYFINEETSIRSKWNLITYIIAEEEFKIGKTMIKSVSSFKTIIERGDKTINDDDVVLLKGRDINMMTIIQFAKDNEYKITCDIEQIFEGTELLKTKKQAKAERRKERREQSNQQTDDTN